jgi:hypothetical protein
LTILSIDTVDTVDAVDAVDAVDTGRAHWANNPTAPSTGVEHDRVDEIAAKVAKFVIFGGVGHGCSFYCINSRGRCALPCTFYSRPKNIASVGSTANEPTESNALKV